MKWAMRLGAIGVMLALSLGLTACGGGSSSSGGRSGVSASYTVGGTVSGLASGQSLTLQNNGGFDLVVTANGSFTFIAAQPTGASYAVTVLTQPSGQTCTVANGSGTVADSNITNVAVTCLNQGETVLYSFTDTNGDGAYPYAGLVMGANGILYGTTYEGGTSDYGTVFEINPSTGEETVLHSFTDANGDGASPTAGLVLGANGTLYGTTAGGGAYGYGTVFEINLSSTTGVETVLYSFTGGADGADPEAGLVMGPHGNLYGTTYGGGTNNDGTVFEINPSTGEETVLHSFTGVNGDGAVPVAGLLDVNGILYGTTKYGGTDNDGTVFQIVP
jgi:uncharacterized repeat protein (TIGR03803 family)